MNDNRILEKDARQKYCPVAKLFNGSSTRVGDSRCLGSGCMAWRWVDVNPPSIVEGNTPLSGHYTRDTGLKTDSGKRVLATSEGYCGLSGRVY